MLPRLHALLKWPLLLSATPQVQPLTILSILIIAAKLIEEALLYFRPNVLHRSFEILGPADRTLAYLFLVISECLGRLGSQIAKGPAFDAGRRLLVGHLQQVGTAFAIPGDAGFPLNGLFPAPASRQESGNIHTIVIHALYCIQEQLRQYLYELRVELVNRLMDELYKGSKEQPDKWWMSFQKRRFMNAVL